ncbi:MAG: DUF4271 domain-containing protein [Bacteroidales bacterium]
MNSDVYFSLDSLVKTHAIPTIPATFPQSASKKSDSLLYDWANVLSYKHPFYQSFPGSKKIFVEHQPAHFARSLNVIPYQKEYAFKNTDFLLAIVLIVLLLYTAISTIFQRYIRQFFYATFIYSESQRLHNDQNATLPSFYAWLNFLTISIFSMFLYLLFRHFGMDISLSSLSLYLFSVMYVLLFLIFRTILIKITGWLLDRRDVFKEYLFQYLLYYKIVALLIFPFLALAIFSGKKWSEFYLAVSFVLFLLSHVFIYTRGTKIILKKGIFIFYWILYLCTAEIVPFLMLYKFISSKVLEL